MNLSINLSVLVCLGITVVFLSGMEGCGKDETPVAFIEAVPEDGSTIQPDETITAIFDGEPIELSVTSGKSSVTGSTVTIIGPFDPGRLNLVLTWTGGTKVLTYTVETPEEEHVEPPKPPPKHSEVLSYTGEVWWMTEAAAKREARNTGVSLARAPGGGIRYHETDDADEVARWVLQTMHNDVVDVLILYGDFPNTIYPPGNVLPDGSLAERWLETPDGDTILNHADWIFWGGRNAKNRERGLQNMMDIPGIEMWGQDTPMRVTARAKRLTPSLRNFSSDRPFHLDRLEGDWFAELILASDTGDARATRADPVIVRDGNLGRIAIVYQTENENNPKGVVAAEIIINYLME